MKTNLTKLLVLLFCSSLYWQFVSWATVTDEPWDADGYWPIWYPASFALSAIAGLALKNRGWMAGAIITFAQLPVILLNTQPGPLLAAGMAILCVLSVPVAATSALTGWLATRAKPRE